MRTALSTLVPVALAILFASGCRNSVAMADSKVLSDSGDVPFATDCPQVAKHAVVGVMQAQRPGIPVDPTCQSGGLCVNVGDEVARNDGNVTYMVRGEFYSGNFGYEVVIGNSTTSCVIKSVTYKYAD